MYLFRISCLQAHLLHIGYTQSIKTGLDLCLQSCTMSRSGFAKSNCSVELFFSFSSADVPAALA